jgi:DNA polymerase elongation subunit (family B)
MSRVINEKCYDEKTLQLKQTKISVASGEYITYSINMTGRVNIDLLKYFRRNENLESYKLDDVSGHFLNSKITKKIDKATFQSKNINGLFIGSYIHFVDDLDRNLFDGKKFQARFGFVRR